MVSVYELNHQQFKSLLNTKCRPHDIFKWAPELYSYLSGLMQEDCTDSTLREWAFQWASDKLHIEYDEIYNKWIGE